MITHRSGQCKLQVTRNACDAGSNLSVLILKEEEEEHRGNTDDHPAGGGDLGFRNITRKCLRISRTLRSDHLEGLDHTRNGTEQSNHRGQ